MGIAQGSDHALRNLELTFITDAELVAENTGTGIAVRVVFDKGRDSGTGSLSTTVGLEC